MHACFFSRASAPSAAGSAAKAAVDTMDEASVKARAGRNNFMSLCLPRQRPVVRDRQRLQVSHQDPDAVGPQPTPERWHAFRPAVVDRLKDLLIRAAIAPAPVGETRSGKTRR